MHYKYSKVCSHRGATTIWLKNGLSKLQFSTLHLDVSQVSIRPVGIVNGNTHLVFNIMTPELYTYLHIYVGNDMLKSLFIPR